MKQILIFQSKQFNLKKKETYKLLSLLKSINHKTLKLIARLAKLKTSIWISISNGI